MFFEPLNFLYMVKQLVTGGGKISPGTGPMAADGGFLRDVDYSKVSFAGSTLSSTAISVGTFCVPRDYDETSDICQFRLTGSTAFAAGTVMTMASQIVLAQVPGSTTTFTSGVRSTSITFPTASTFFDFTVDFSGLGLKRDTVFTVSTVASGQPGSTKVGGGFLTYASCLVAYNQFDSEVVGSTLQPIRG